MHSLGEPCHQDGACVETDKIRGHAASLSNCLPVCSCLAVYVSPLEWATHSWGFQTPLRVSALRMDALWRAADPTRGEE